MPQTVGVSLKPSTYSEGAGLLDDEDVIIKEARFTQFDYNGKLPAVPAAELTLDRGDGDTTKQYYSVGKTSDWAPSEDGKTLSAIGKATALVKSSNWAFFVTALVNAGFPENRIEADISIFEGLEAHVIRAAAPERKGIIKKEKEFEATILVVDKIHKYPWEKATKATTGRGKGKAAATTKDSPTDSKIEEQTTEFVMSVLAENPDGIEKKKLPQMAFAKLKDIPPTDRNKIVKLVFSDEYLSSTPFWVYADGMITPLAAE